MSVTFLSVLSCLLAKTICVSGGKKKICLYHNLFYITVNEASVQFVELAYEYDMIWYTEYHHGVNGLLGDDIQSNSTTSCVILCK